jgi:hypothetical protein
MTVKIIALGTALALSSTPLAEPMPQPKILGTQNGHGSDSSPLGGTPDAPKCGSYEVRLSDSRLMVSNCCSVSHCPEPEQSCQSTALSNALIIRSVAMADIQDQRDAHPLTEKKKKEGDWFSLPSIIVGLGLGYVAALISFIYALFYMLELE